MPGPTRSISFASPDRRKRRRSTPGCRHVGPAIKPTREEKVTMRNPTRRRVARPLLMATAAGLLLSTGAYADPPTAQYGLAWEETFSGSSVDTSRWNFRT